MPCTPNRRSGTQRDRPPDVKVRGQVQRSDGAEDPRSSEWESASGRSSGGRAAAGGDRPVRGCLTPRKGELQYKMRLRFIVSRGIRTVRRVRSSVNSGNGTKVESSRM